MNKKFRCVEYCVDLHLETFAILCFTQHTEYFLGGHTGQPSPNTNKKQILVYDPWNNTWRHETDMTVIRVSHAVSVLPDIWSFCH